MSDLERAKAEAKKVALRMAERKLDETRIGAALALFLDKLQETHVIVPTEPSSEMILAGASVGDVVIGRPNTQVGRYNAIQVYRAMIEAASPTREHEQDEQRDISGDQ